MCIEFVEGEAQAPNDSFNFVFLQDDTPRESDTEEEFSPTLGLPSQCINTSITFKKPSNTTKGPKSAIFDEDTQCETQSDDSDLLSNCSEEDFCSMSEEDYLHLMERTSFLVREAKESKRRGLMSPSLLRNKMYDLLSRKSTPLEANFLFEEGDLDKSEAIVGRNSFPSLERLYHSAPRKIGRRS